MMRVMKSLIAAASLAGVLGAQQGEQLDEPTPRALVMVNGEDVSSPDTWRHERRPELRAMFDQHVYGRMPARPDTLSFDVTERDPRALDGAATRKQVELSFSVGENAASIGLLIYIPNDREGPAPAFLGLNFGGNHTVLPDPAITLPESWVSSRRAGVVDGRATDAGRGTATTRWDIERTIARGYAVATVYNGDIDPDRDDSSNGVQSLYYADGQARPADDEWGTISAWAWGLHRAMDYLQTDEDIDGEAVAVMGHSRNGKTALWAGATDERFALVISNQSGCGGAAISRRRSGETVKKINDRFPHWFCGNFKEFNEREGDLPVDQHLLIALIAPRPTLVCSARGDSWADPEGEFLALVGADPAYRLLGTDGLAVTEMPALDTLVRSTLGYHIRPGRHAIGPRDWSVFIEFADQHLGR